MAGHIKIGDVAPRIQYAANGTQTRFPYPFPVFADADLDVYEDAALKTLARHYGVSGAGESGGGAVTFVTAPADGAVVTIVRSLAIARTTDFQESGEFRAKVINDELDRLTAFIQQVNDRVDRSAQLSSTSAGAADLSLPDPEAGKLLGWNAAADGLENKAPEITGATASALAEGAPAAASYDAATGVISFGLPTGAAGATGAPGADGSDGLFSGAEATVPADADDLVAIKDASDSGSPKFATARSIAGLVARGASETDMRLAFLLLAENAGDRLNMVDGIADPFTDETDVDAAASANGSYDASGNFYKPALGGAPIEMGTWNDAQSGAIAIGNYSFNKAHGFSFTPPQTMSIASVALEGTAVGTAGGVHGYIAPDNGAAAPSHQVGAAVASAKYVPHQLGAMVWSFVDCPVVGGRKYWFAGGRTGGAHGAFRTVNDNAGYTSSSGGSNNAANTLTYDGQNMGGKDLRCKIVGYAFENMTIVSEAFAADAAPDTGRIHIQVMEKEGITVNTDLTAEISRDGGGAWAAAALALQETLADGTKAYEDAGVDLSGLPGGASVKYRIKTLNAKRIEIHGVVMQWA